MGICPVLRTAGNGGSGKILRLDFHIPAPAIIFLIFRSDGTEDAAGISHSHHIGRDILCDNASCADYGIFSDGDTGKDDGPCADPYIVSDADRQIILGRFFPQAGEDGMGSGSDGYIGTDHHRIPDPDMGIVHQCQVKVGVNVMSKVGIASPVGVKGRVWLKSYKISRAASCLEAISSSVQK